MQPTQLDLRKYWQSGLPGRNFEREPFICSFCLVYWRRWSWWSPLEDSRFPSADLTENRAQCRHKFFSSLDCFFGLLQTVRILLFYLTDGWRWPSLQKNLTSAEFHSSATVLLRAGGIRPLHCTTSKLLSSWWRHYQHSLQLTRGERPWEVQDLPPEV